MQAFIVSRPFRMPLQVPLLLSRHCIVTALRLWLVPCYAYLTPSGWWSSHHIVTALRLWLVPCYAYLTPSGWWTSWYFFSSRKERRRRKGRKWYIDAESIELHVEIGWFIEDIGIVLSPFWGLLEWGGVLYRGCTPAWVLSPIQGWYYRASSVALLGLNCQFFRQYFAILQKMCNFAA